MRNETELAEANRLYAAAHAAHYTGTRFASGDAALQADHGIAPQ